MATTFIVFALLACLSNALATPPSGYTLVFDDEFTGTSLDTTHWTYDHLGGYRTATNTTAAVSVNNGLTITAYTDASGNDYTGYIDMRYKYQPLYGYIEAKIQTVNTGGDWSAFWMWVDSYGGTGAAPYYPHTDGTEADIMEHRALNSSQTDISSQVDSALHWDNYNADEKSASNGLRGSGLGSGYHIYGLLWTPTSQSFYIDGAYQYTINNDTQADPPTVAGTPNPATGPISQTSEYLLLTTEVQNNSWAGNRPSGGYGSLATSTTKMNVAYVRVYQQNPPTPSVPAEVTARNVSGGVALDWDMPDNAPYYNVKRSTTPGGPYTTIAAKTGIADLSHGVCYTDTTGVAGTTYYYVVSAVNGTTESANSAEVTNNAAGQPNYVHSGTWSVQGIFSGQASYAHLYQNVSVSTNTNYTAGFWIRGSGGTCDFMVRDAVTHTVLGQQYVSANSTWTYWSVSFNSGTTTSAQFYVDDSSSIVGSVSIDDAFLGLSGGSNLLVNPGFEAGTTSSWNPSAGTVWTARQVTGISPNVHSGLESAKGIFSGTASYAHVMQTVNVTASTDYVAGLWLKGTGTIRLMARDGVTGTSLANEFIAATPAWTYISMPFNSGSSTTVKFYFDDSSSVAGTVYVDDTFMGISGGTNLLANPGFESGTTSWSISTGTVWSPGQW